MDDQDCCCLNLEECWEIRKALNELPNFKHLAGTKKVVAQPTSHHYALENSGILDLKRARKVYFIALWHHPERLLQ